MGDSSPGVPGCADCIAVGRLCGRECCFRTAKLRARLEARDAEVARLKVRLAQVQDNLTTELGRHVRSLAQVERLKAALVSCESPHFCPSCDEKLGPSTHKPGCLLNAALSEPTPTGEPSGICSAHQTPDPMCRLCFIQPAPPEREEAKPPRWFTPDCPHCLVCGRTRAAHSYFDVDHTFAHSLGCESSEKPGRTSGGG